MYSLIEKIGNNEKIIAFFVFIAGTITVFDMIFGFQAMTITTSDIWHHRAVLLALTENPIHPSNPHILSDAGSRTFIPIYVAIGFMAYVFGFSATVSLAIASIINLALLFLGAKYFARSIGSQRYMLLLFIIIFAWLLPPAYTGFHNIRSIVATNAFPAAHSFGLTLIIWGLFIKAIKSPKIQIERWGLITVLLSVNILSHQITALFCIGALAVFIFIPPRNYINSTTKTILSVAIAVILTLFWPYFDMITIVSSASNGGWFGAAWFYKLRPVLEISLPALVGLIFVVKLRHLRIVNVMSVCAIGMFVAYLGTHLIQIDAGHRLLPYWIFFLQIILFIALQPELTGSSNPSIIDKMKPLFLLGLIPIAGFHSYQSITDVWHHRAIFHENSDFSYKSYEPKYYSEAIEKIKDDLPDNSIVIGFNRMSFPFQAFGISVVSIPQEAPMISDLALRQKASKDFFKPDLSCEQRLQIAKSFASTHAAFENKIYENDQSILNDKVKQQLAELGEIVTYDNLISIIKIPDQCPSD